MKETLNISIAKDFSKFPGGRFKTDGPYTGEHFREDWLVPNLLNETKVLVDLDGAMGYSSSFLEEAFGGLIRAGFTKECLNKLLVIKSDNEPSLIEEINQYIKESSLNG